MVYRHKPEVSAYEEGQWSAENRIDYWQANKTPEEALATIQDAGQKAFELLQHPWDDEHAELLRGYLSKFD